MQNHQRARDRIRILLLRPKKCENGDIALHMRTRDLEMGLKDLVKTLLRLATDVQSVLQPRQARCSIWFGGESDP